MHDNQFLAGQNAAIADMILGVVPWTLDPGYTLLAPEFRMGYEKALTRAVPA
jgi:hypothetical protein